MPKVMIVDDDRTTVKLLQTLLELDGFEVLSAARGQDAFELAFETYPDVFMIDFHLLDMDGLELVTQLRDSSEFAQVPIVVASGLDKEEAALEAGANQFLIKPFEPNALARMFNDLIG